MNGGCIEISLLKKPQTKLFKENYYTVLRYKNEIIFAPISFSKDRFYVAAVSVKNYEILNILSLENRL